MAGRKKRINVTVEGKKVEIIFSTEWTGADVTDFLDNWNRMCREMGKRPINDDKSMEA